MSHRTHGASEQKLEAHDVCLDVVYFIDISISALLVAAHEIDFTTHHRASSCCVKRPHWGHLLGLCQGDHKKPLLLHAWNEPG